MKVLFCDWNGTLLDDMPIWDEARRKTFLAFGVGPPTVADYFRELESGDYLEVYRKRGITASRDELNAIYEPAYGALVPQAKLFPEIQETLLRLSERGVILALVTAQQETLVVPLLEKFGIYHYFKYLVFHALDKKAAIAKVVQDEGVNLNECYLVGDSPSDMRHGKKAGVITIALFTGYIPDELLKATKPDHCVRTFKKILNLIC